MTEKYFAKMCFLKKSHVNIWEGLKYILQNTLKILNRTYLIFV